MAAFFAKQVVGKKLESVKGALSSGDDKDERKAAQEEEAEMMEAKREAEERRKEKHRKMEDEREKLRQDIRDKYGLKKKEELMVPDSDPRLHKKRSNVGFESEDDDAQSSGYNRSRGASMCRGSDAGGRLSIVSQGNSANKEKCSMQ